MIESILSWRGLIMMSAVALTSCQTGRNIQLHFQTPKDAAERHRCYAMKETKPDTLQPNCLDSTSSDDALAGKEDATHVVIAKCERTPDPYVYHTITILDADSARPTVLIACGQNPPVVH